MIVNQDNSGWPRALRARPSWRGVAVTVGAIVCVLLFPLVLLAVGGAVTFGWPIVLAYALFALSVVLAARWFERHRPGTRLAHFADRLVDYVPLLLALLGCALMYWMWCGFAQSVRPGMRVRPMNEAMLVFATTGAGYLVGLPVIAWRFKHKRNLTALIVSCLLLVAPFFVSAYLQETVVRELDLFVKP